MLCFSVNRIKEQYKVSVWIPQEPDRSGLVRIEGDPKGVQLARRELMEMAQRMVRTAGGGAILSHSFGIMARQLGRSPYSMVTTVFSPPGQENERTKDLIVEQKFHRAIIGQKGEKIKEVRDKFPEVTRFNFFF